MSILFTPIQVGKLALANRMVHSATYEAMAEESGAVTEELIRRYRNLARGGVGLIIPGYMYIHPTGRAMKYQTGIHSSDMMPGLKKLVEAVHAEGGKIVFQLNHAGRQTEKKLSGTRPISPSGKGRDPFYFVRPRKMKEKDIADAVKWFAAAAARAVTAGADGIQLHAAHGYLINQFLSPFFNRRRDAWGGSAEKQFRFLRSVVHSVRMEMPHDMPLLVKLNSMDHTPKPGITPEIAATYARWLAGLGVACLEVSCGTAFYSFMNLCRGEVPVEEMVSGLPLWKRPVGRLVLGKMVDQFDLEEGYNLAAARKLNSAIGDVPLSVVGGIRRVGQMEAILKNGDADLISMSRPLIREPFLPRRFESGKQTVAGCVSCNKCLAAVINGRPLRCYYKGEPASA